MKKAVWLAMILSMMLVVSASAAPMMLGKGHKSLGFQADTSSPSINFGWNIADMTRFQIGGAWSNVEPQAPEGTEVDSNSSWGFDVGIAKFLSGMTNEVFSPFIGANFLIRDDGDGIDTGFGVRGFFGVEAFVIDNLSIGGNIGVQYIKEGDRQQGTENITGSKTVTTSSSAITANIYW